MLWEWIVNGDDTTLYPTFFRVVIMMIVSGIIFVIFCFILLCVSQCRPLLIIEFVLLLVLVRFIVVLIVYKEA